MKRVEESVVKRASGELFNTFWNEIHELHIK